MLESFGYEAILADTGKKAIEIFETMGERISLVILDLIMPGMGGARCLEKLLSIGG